MKLLNLLALPAALAVEYAEHLRLQPLPDHHLHADFDFTATTPLSDYDAQHFRYFPRSLAQILQYTHTSELHLRFALGRWDEESWGARPRHGMGEGGTGVELWAWIEGNVTAEVEERWSGLVNSLSGLFCASLNFIDETKTIRPEMTFEPEGTRPSTGQKQLLHGMLPHEVVCTENLTPFLKLLPCKGKAGISSLLDGHKLFDASWQSMAIDVRPICPSGDVQSADCVLEIQQSVSMALSIPRSMRDRHNPIPRPPPIEEIACDESKQWNGHDTCYPKPIEGQMSWNLSKIFGRPLKGACPLGETNMPGQVSLNDAGDCEIVMTGGMVQEAGNGAQLYKLEAGVDFDLQVAASPNIPTLPAPALHVSRQITGSGQERGGMHIVLRNPHAEAKKVVYLESLPWFLRPYVHTLSISGGTLDKMFYTPAIDRKRGTQLELLLAIPANGEVVMEYDFEKAGLRYTEYPPDANRGFDIAPAVIRVLPAKHSFPDAAGQALSSEKAGSQGEYLRTTSLLLPLPTPDFSMPYNVIILTSTVIALGFGSIFNLLVRRFVLVEEVPETPLKGVIERVRGKVLAALGKGGETGQDGRAASGREGEKTNGVVTNGVESKSDDGGGCLRSRKGGG